MGVDILALEELNELLVRSTFQLVNVHVSKWYIPSSTLIDRPLH